MNLILGMIVRNEASILPLTLPVTREVSTLKIALDFDSTDGTREILRNHGWLVLDGGPWRNDYAWARNELLASGRAFASPGTWMLQLDADECMWPADIESVSKLASETDYSVIALPRYNYVAKGNLYDAGSYPDEQARCVGVFSSVKWKLPVHEVIDREFAVVLPPNEHIHHYGWCKPPHENWLRSHNYLMISQGKPLLKETPKDFHITEEQFVDEISKRHKLEPFTGRHPLEGKL